MMTVTEVVPFLLVSAAATALPGPAVLYVVSAGIGGGARGFVPGVAGILCADALYFTLSVAGLGAFVLASYHLFTVVKAAGALYLVYLGLHLLWSAVRQMPGGAAAPAAVPTRGRWLSGGFTVHAANPKALLYFCAVVPQFVRPEEPLVAQAALLGLSHLAVASGVLCAYGYCAARVRVYAAKPAFSRALQAASGSLLVAAGVGLVSLKRRAG